MSLRSRTGLVILGRTPGAVPGIVYGMDKDTARDELRRAAMILRSHDAAREELQRRRDEALAAARAAGVSWVQMQEDSGLSVGAVRSALAREVPGE